MLGLPHWYRPTLLQDLTGRDAPRPAVAPFSASDQNGMIDDEFKPLQLGYPPEKSEEEDDVMMDFVSGR